MSASDLESPWLVVMGASLGGLAAVERVLAGLPDDFEPAVVVVQHRSSDSTEVLARLLGRSSAQPVVEPDSGEPIRHGRVYLAPPGYHLLVEGDDTFGLSTEGPVTWARPSIDVLFESAAQAWGSHLVGVLLTGSSDDGARGVATLLEHGGIALIQDPDEAESPVAPRAALELAPEAPRLQLDEIPERLVYLTRSTRSAARTDHPAAGRAARSSRRR